ncbi:DegT family aminotransferase [Helicobacter canis]|uniref:DegT family aminotransferase n=2 Tax=Helicobacter canis TaxID=29419 RepID=A0A377J4W6_9HELI|nr:DegT family aminotransferase [Helicobacter canis]
MDKNKDSRACDSASEVACNDKQNADNQKVDSRIFTQTAQSLSPAPALSLRALKKGEAIHKATAQKVDSSVKVDSMDCHAAAHAAARNDDKKVDSRRNAQNLETPQVAKPTPSPCDSKILELESTFDKTAQNAFDSQAIGGRIFDEKAGLCSLLCGDKTDGLSHKQKANSPLFRKKPTPQTKIPLIDLHAQYHAHKPELDSAIASVLRSQHFILGEHSQALESELASFVGRRFCITCSSGTSALLLALLALDIGAGDEVITPSFSFIAAAEMVAFLGAKPVFVDICPHTYTLDIAQVKHAISPRTRAIIPVSLFGQPYDVAGLESLAKPHAIPIIEDGAQSFGAAIMLGNGAKSARSGSFGDLSITSFFPSKPLGGYGDGGAVFCDDEKLATKLYALRNHGQASKYRHTMLGLNARLDELQCAILRVKLRHFARELHLREQVAARYCTLLAPLQKHLALPYIAPNRTSVFAQFCLRVKDSRGDWVVGRHLPDLAQHNQSSSQAAQSSVAIHTKKVDSSVKVDSRSDYSASAECMDSKETSPSGERYPLFSKETSANAERYPLFSKEAALCHAAANAAARNDEKKVDSSLESTFDNATNLNESQDKTAQSLSPAPTLSLRALKKGEAIHKATAQKVDSSVEVDSMDCHAAAHAAARNDDKHATAQKVDSSTTANLNELAKDSKICDEKSLLCERVQGRILGVCNCSTREAIKDLSRKAESTNKAESPQQNEDSSTTITRTHIISALNAQGIATAIHYPTPLHLQEVFSHLGYKKGDFPISEQIAQEIFSIPFSPYLTEATQEHIARVLCEIFAQI